MDTCRSRGPSSLKSPRPRVTSHHDPLQSNDPANDRISVTKPLLTLSGPTGDACSRTSASSMDAVPGFNDSSPSGSTPRGAGPVARTRMSSSSESAQASRSDMRKRHLEPALERCAPVRLRRVVARLGLLEQHICTNVVADHGSRVAPLRGRGRAALPRATCSRGRVGRPGRTAVLTGSAHRFNLLPISLWREPSQDTPRTSNSRRPLVVLEPAEWRSGFSSPVIAQRGCPRHTH